MGDEERKKKRRTRSLSREKWGDEWDVSACCLQVLMCTRYLTLMNGLQLLAAANRCRVSPAPSTGSELGYVCLL